MDSLAHCKNDHGAGRGSEGDETISLAPTVLTVDLLFVTYSRAIICSWFMRGDPSVLQAKDASEEAGRGR